VCTRGTSSLHIVSDHTTLCLMFMNQYSARHAEYWFINTIFLTFIHCLLLLYILPLCMASIYMAYYVLYIYLTVIHGFVTSFDITLCFQYFELHVLEYLGMVTWVIGINFGFGFAMSSASQKTTRWSDGHSDLI